MSVIYDPNHVAEALDRLLEQYRNSPRLKGVLTSVVTGIQDIEDMLFDIKDHRSIYNAIGETLENIGTLVGVTRIAGENDATLRGRILGAVFTNRSEGTPDTLIQVVQSLSDSTKIIYKQGAIGSFSFELNDEVMSQQDILNLFRAIKGARPVGVLCEQVTQFNAANGFAFAGGDGTGGGFSDLASPSSGGIFANQLFTQDVQYVTAENGVTIISETGDLIIAEQAAVNGSI